MVYTKPAKTKHKAVVPEDISSLSASRCDGLGEGGEDGLGGIESEIHTRAGGGSSELELERERELLRQAAEGLVRRHGYETVVSAVVEAGEAIEKEHAEGVELLTQEQVAQLAKVAKATVHDWGTDGKLKPRKYELYVGPAGLQPLFDKQEVVEFLRKKRPPGRPKGGPAEVGKEALTES